MLLQCTLGVTHAYTPQSSPLWTYINKIGSEFSWHLLTSNQMVKSSHYSLYEMLNSSKPSADWGYFIRFQWIDSEKDMTITSNPGYILFLDTGNNITEPFERIMGKRNLLMLYRLQFYDACISLKCKYMKWLTITSRYNHFECPITPSHYLPTKPQFYPLFPIVLSSIIIEYILEIGVLWNTTFRQNSL